MLYYPASILANRDAVLNAGLSSAPMIEEHRGGIRGDSKSESDGEEICAACAGRFVDRYHTRGYCRGLGADDECRRFAQALARGESAFHRWQTGASESDGGAAHRSGQRTAS